MKTVRARQGNPDPKQSKLVALLPPIPYGPRHKGRAWTQRARDRAGQMSIRINDQWRICFRWIDHDAWDVEIVDYH
jgi:hypothetical protein